MVLVVASLFFRSRIALANFLDLTNAFAYQSTSYVVHPSSYLRNQLAAHTSHASHDLRIITRTLTSDVLDALSTSRLSRTSRASHLTHLEQPTRCFILDGLAGSWQDETTDLTDCQVHIVSARDVTGMDV